MARRWVLSLHDPLLFPLVTLIIMDVFLQKMRIKKNRKMLIIEEAWKAIASPMMAEYIKYLYKTARKFWASVGVVTQEIQDIIGSEIVKEAIINNSDVVMLLDQSKFKERFDTIKAILGLTDVDCKKIFPSTFGAEYEPLSVRLNRAIRYARRRTLPIARG